MRKNGGRGGDQHTTRHPTSESWLHEAPEAGDHYVHQSQWHHEFPCEVHQLIHSQARQGTADPDEQTDQGEQFPKKPQVRRHPAEEVERRMPSSQEPVSYTHLTLPTSDLV